MEPAILRPLSIGEILDVGIKIVWRHAWTLMRIVLLVVAPVQIIGAIVQASAVSDSFIQVQYGTQTPEEAAPLADEDFYAGIAAYLITALLGFVATTLAVGASFKAVADAYLGEPPNWRTSVSFALRRLHSLLWLTFIYYLLVGLGFLFCLVPGIYLGIAWIVAIPVLMTEGVKGRHALGRSRDLVQGRWWPALGLTVIGLLMAGFITGVIQFLLGAVLLTDTRSALFILTVSALAATLSALISTPLVAAFRTVLYFDLRVRHEGFDLQLLAERIGVEPDPNRPALAPQETGWPSGPSGSGSQPPYWPPPPGWQPEPTAAPAPAPDPQQPPYWPPPPDWKPSEEAPPEPGETPPAPEEPPRDPKQPPYWPPPPGWRPEE